MKYLFVMGLLGMSTAQAGPVGAINLGAKEIRPLPTVDVNIARADNACANFAAAIISKMDQEYAEQMPAWRDTCATHPTRITCEDTLDTVKMVRGNSMGLVCGVRKAGENSSDYVASR